MSKLIELEGYNHDAPKDAPYDQKRIKILLPIETVEHLQTMQSEVGLNLIIKQYIANTSINIQNDLASLDDDVLRYKALMLTAKTAFKTAKEEHLNQVEAIWTKIDESIPSTTAEVKKIVDVLKPLTTELKSISEYLNKIDTYNIEKVFKVLKQFNDLYGEEKKMFEFLVTNYNK